MKNLVGYHVVNNTVVITVEDENEVCENIIMTHPSGYNGCDGFSSILDGLGNVTDYMVARCLTHMSITFNDIHNDNKQIVIECRHNLEGYWVEVDEDSEEQYFIERDYY